MYKVITIGRQFGSGGREFGRRLAEELGYEYYDKEIISEIAKKTSLSEEYVSEVLDNRPHPLYPITIGHTISISDSFQLKQVQSVYEAHCELLKSLASKSNCIIVGRCADYILKDFKPFKIFIYADLEARVDRCIKRQSEDEKYSRKQLRKMIVKIDKNRARYYDFFANQTWGGKDNYDLCINTTNQVIKDIVPVMAKIFKD